MWNRDASHVAVMLQRARSAGISPPRTKDPPTVVWRGAGCSITAGIPACDRLVEDLLKALKLSGPHDYQELMKTLNSDDRRRQITRLVEAVRLNWAHIALAHLIREDYVNFVLSTNFDPLIEYACNLLGYPKLAVYDLPSTSRDTFKGKRIREPALIYLHGRHNGFEQVNIDEEIDRNRPLVEAALEWCKDFAWLIIGYGGTNMMSFST